MSDRERSGAVPGNSSSIVLFSGRQEHLSRHTCAHPSNAQK